MYAVQCEVLDIFPMKALMIQRLLPQNGKLGEVSNKSLDSFPQYIALHACLMKELTNNVMFTSV